MRKDFEDRIYFQSELLSQLQGITHCFSTKSGGVSNGKVSGLNLGFRCGDERNAVNENYRLVAKDMNFPFERITAGRQTHSSNIRVITEADAGKGISRESEFNHVDGLVTNHRGLPLVVYYADCVPILLADEIAGVVGAVHSGWRGTVSKIAEKAVETMVSEFGSQPENIKAAIGPSIGPCCFETGEEVACQFDSRFVSQRENGKFLVDLWEANLRVLAECGIKSENTDVLGICTMCERDMLYSYRAHGDATGRMGAFIMLND